MGFEDGPAAAGRGRDPRGDGPWFSEGGERQRTALTRPADTPSSPNDSSDALLTPHRTIGCRAAIKKWLQGEFSTERRFELTAMIDDGRHNGIGEEFALPPAQGVTQPSTPQSKDNS